MVEGPRGRDYGKDNLIMEKHLKKLTLLHSNDMHGDFMTEELDNKLVGGVSMLSGYISEVRAKEKNTLYCIAGDMFTGSIIDSEYKGMSTIELMNIIDPDVVTLGNHEVDYGLAHLLFIEKCANFPIINANMYIKSNHARLFHPMHIAHLDGMKILFIGVLTEETLAKTSQDEIGAFINIKEAGKEVGRICDTYNSEDVDLTVLLTHIGFEEDKKLAALLKPEWGVDLIIGGHSHTLPEEPAVVNGIPIVQAGVGTNQIGRFDLVINTDTNALESYKWQIVPIDEEHCPRDKRLEKLLKEYQIEVDKKYCRFVTRFKRKLTHPSRYQETELGALCADILAENLGLDLFLMASGSVRREEMGPIVTYGDFCEFFPYDDKVWQVSVDGKQLRSMVKHFLRDEAWTGAHTEFYQISKGFEITYSKSTQEFERFTFRGEEVSDDRIFRVGIQDYHYGNREDSFHMTEEELSKYAKPRVIASSCTDILEEYFVENRLLDVDIRGRLVIKE